MTYQQAMQQPDRFEYIKAMVKEVENHFEREHWEIVKRSTIGGAKTLRVVWSFKWKRNPLGILTKHKARLCVEGHMQEYGINYWETYAPVVKWLSVRTMLTLSIIEDLHSKSIDFVLTYP